MKNIYHVFDNKAKAITNPAKKKNGQESIIQIFQKVIKSKEEIVLTIETKQYEGENLSIYILKLLSIVNTLLYMEVYLEKQEYKFLQLSRDPARPSDYM